MELGVEGSVLGLARVVDYIKVLEVGAAEAKSRALGANLHELSPPTPSLKRLKSSQNTQNFELTDVFTYIQTVFSWKTAGLVCRCPRD